MTLIATQVKRRRGTTAENDAFTGAEGEITVDLGNKELRVHVGDNKAGGYGVARKDFKNLTDEAKNIGNWSSNVSNCITHIPQDIKLELNNGTLTLKAGSKVYVPNGAGVFDVVTIANDVTISGGGSATIDLMVFYNQTTNAIKWDGLPNCYSGGSAPTGQTNMSWYDTTNNIIKYTNNSGSTWSSGLALPIAIVSMTNGVLTSIKQVFNGFGYIGSTVFALPGVKGLIPNGFNDDGSLKNTTFNVTSVISETDLSNFTDHIFVGTDGSTVSRFGPVSFNYNQYTNKNESAGSVVSQCIFARVYRISGKVETLDSATVFHALDYNDSDYIAHQAMPSGRYIDLTLGASGAMYLAPADGYVAIRHYFASENNANFVGIYSENPAGIDIMQSRPAQSDVATFMPIKKGHQFRVYYNSIAPNVASYFRFVFAEGVL